MRIFFSLVAAILSLALAPQAQSRQTTSIEVTQAWSRSAAAGTNGAGFMTLTNRGRVADTLQAIRSPLAARVEMHQTSMEHGIMSMRRLDAGLRLLPGQSVTFAPGGYHLMFVGLTKALSVGDRVPVVLVFKSGAQVMVSFPVTGTAPSPTVTKK